MVFERLSTAFRQRKIERLHPLKKIVVPNWRIYFLLWSAVMIFALRNTKDNQPMKRINREFCLTDSTVN